MLLHCEDDRDDNPTLEQDIDQAQYVIRAIMGDDAYIAWLLGTFYMAGEMTSVPLPRLSIEYYDNT